MENQSYQTLTLVFYYSDGGEQTLAFLLLNS